MSDNIYIELEDNIRAIIQACLPENFNEEVDIIFSFQSEEEPSPNYVVVSILEMEKLALAEHSSYAVQNTNDQYEIVTNVPYRIFTQFDFIGESAGYLSLYAHSKLGSSLNEKELNSYLNLGVATRGNIRRRPQKRDTKYIDIRSFDVSFNAILSYKETVGVINQVVLQDPHNDTLINIPPSL